MSQYIDAIHPVTSSSIGSAQSSLDRWAGLSNLNRYLLGSSTLIDLLERATRSIVEILELSYAKVMTVESNGRYYCRMTYSESDGVVDHIRNSTVTAIKEKVFRKVTANKPPFLPCLLDDSFFPEERSAFLDNQNKHVWLVPLSINSQGIGILELGRQETKDGCSSLINSSHLVELIAGQLASAMNRIKLNERLSNTSGEMVKALTKALEVRDNDSGMHSQNMATLASQLAKRVGCSEKEALEVYWAALLHDIGKIGIEDRVLHKPSSLNEEEWVLIRRHPEMGAKIVQGMTGLDAVAPLILCHHERMDGSGYPKGLKGDKIPLGARIIAVVDTFSAIIEGRVYQPKRVIQDAVDELIKERGAQFDADIVDAFVKMIQERAFII
jgi:putative nucleotidyltransferase with HDIG domain